MALFKVRPFIPEWAGYDIGFVVAIQIAESCAFAPEFVRELSFFECMHGFSRGSGNGEQKSSG